jgi:hypothetical protein
MTYGNTFAVWRGNTPAWPAYTRHKFVQGLGDGTLLHDAFLHYLKQDYVFLIHFSRAWALAITKADTVAEMRLAAGTVNGLINEEIALHIKSCAKAGIDEATLFATQERQENLAYTRYVLDAGHSGDQPRPRTPTQSGSTPTQAPTISRFATMWVCLLTGPLRGAWVMIRKAARVGLPFRRGLRWPLNWKSGFGTWGWILEPTLADDRIGDD